MTFLEDQSVLFEPVEVMSLLTLGMATSALEEELGITLENISDVFSDACDFSDQSKECNSIMLMIAMRLVEDLHGKWMERYDADQFSKDSITYFRRMEAVLAEELGINLNSCNTQEEFDEQIRKVQENTESE